MPANTVRAEARLTLARIISVAYQRDSGFVASLHTQKGPFSVKLSANGEVTLKTETENLTFQASQREKSRIGLRVKRLEATFRQNEDHFTYSITARLAGLSISVAGAVRLEKLITACSGLLCRAARVINADDRWFADQAKKAFIDK